MVLEREVETEKQEEVAVVFFCMAETGGAEDETLLE